MLLKLFLLHSFFSFAKYSPSVPKLTVIITSLNKKDNRLAVVTEGSERQQMKQQTGSVAIQNCNIQSSPSHHQNAEIHATYYHITKLVLQIYVHTHLHSTSKNLSIPSSLPIHYPTFITHPITRKQSPNSSRLSTVTYEGVSLRYCVLWGVCSLLSTVQSCSSSNNYKK